MSEPTYSTVNCHVYTWKNKEAVLLARSLVGLNQPICRPCRDDISRLLKNAEHQPRWKKRGKLDGNFCCWPGCNNPTFVCTHIATAVQLQALACKDEFPQQCFPVPTPLCKTHYYLVYKELNPTQTHCSTCEINLRNSIVRQCPDPQKIQHYLAEHTEFEGKLSEQSVVCFSCYRSQLCMLKSFEGKSTDSDLSDVIIKLRACLLPVESLSSIPDVISRAMTQTSIFVAETILNQEALLLPAVHEYFSRAFSTYAVAANLQAMEEEKEGTVTASWILSNLVNNIGYHLSYTCCIRKHSALP